MHSSKDPTPKMPIPYLALSDEQLFQVVNVILPCWLMLMLIPTSRITHALCVLSTFLLSVLYVALLVPLLQGGLDFRNFTTLKVALWNE